MKQKLLTVMLVLLLSVRMGSALSETILRLPGSLEEIGPEAFQSDESITAVYIPSGVRRISEGVFSGCTGLTDVYFGGSSAEREAMDIGPDNGPLELAGWHYPEPEPVYRALLIGNTYSGEYELSGCVPDAEAMSGMLGTMNGTPYRTVIERDLTANGMLAAIRSAFAGAEEKDVSLFYYSGHGLEYTGTLFGNDMSILSLSALRSALDQVPGTKIVILDSCYSGAAIDKSDRSGAASFTDRVIEAFSLTGKNGELKGAGYYVLVSCSKTQTSIGFVGYVSLFTNNLTDACGWSCDTGSALPGIPADTDGNGAVTLQEAYTGTAANVEEMLRQMTEWDGNQYEQDIRCWPENSSFVLWSRKNP